jgi:hypothetical protein
VPDGKCDRFGIGTHVRRSFDYIDWGIASISPTENQLTRLPARLSASAPAPTSLNQDVLMQPRSPTGRE